MSFSFYDSILTLEALTMYSIKAKEANLNMVVDIEYKTKGERISRIQLTQQKPVAKPIEVTQNDDVIVKTAMSTGVSFVKLKTVYYVMTESNENCLFDTNIDIRDRDSNSDDPMLLTQRIVACAKFKPPENSLETESALTVMEINLPTGVTPVLDDLDSYLNGLESRISNYEVIGDKVVLQIDSIPSDNFECVGFRIQEEFETGMTKASEFTVYEYQAPAYKCTKLYQKETRKLLRLCEEDHCQCMAARNESWDVRGREGSTRCILHYLENEERILRPHLKESSHFLQMRTRRNDKALFESECCNFNSTIDPTITAEQRMIDICKDSVKYALKVVIESSEAGGDFVIYKAKVQSVLKKGATDDLNTYSEIELIKKASCSSTEFKVGKQYLIMTADSIKIKVNRSYKHKFPLDSEAFVDWWPLESDCRDANCKQYLKVLDGFEFDYLLNGCDFVKSQ